MIFQDIPDVHSKYFIRNGRWGHYKDYGGYNPCPTGNKEIFQGSALNNCTGGAWGCFAMAENNPNCKVGFLSEDWHVDNAGAWYNNGEGKFLDDYDRGQEAKEGAIICYSSEQGGHVAFVNEILSDGTLKLISSGWGNQTDAGLEWRYVTPPEYKWQVGKSVKGFQGFIYPKKSKVDYKTLYQKAQAKLDRIEAIINE